MNAVEEIEAAIEKLTEMRELSNEGGAQRTWKSTPLSPFIQADVIDSDGDVIAERCYAPDAEFIVTLHRTSDAQLDFLRTARGFYGAGLTGDASSSLFAEHALQLARAINGVA